MWASAPASSVIEREVTASPDEFVRGLLAAFPETVQDGPQRFRSTFRGAVMDVEWAPRAPRRIGGLVLPLLLVTIRFASATPDERAVMLARLDLATQRGGG